MTCISLNKIDNIILQKIIYYIFYLKYFKTFTYRIAHVIFIYKNLKKMFNHYSSMLFYLNLFLNYFKTNII